MNEIIVIIAALLPAILLWLYVWKKDPQPEPKMKLVTAVLLGIVICIPVGFLEMGISHLMFGADGEPTSFAGTTAIAFLEAALPEEVFKLLALWLVLRKNSHFDEYYDGIVYAVCVGLGFAAIENVFYLYGEEEWVLVAIVRALLAVPGHYIFAILMGYYYSIYHFKDRSLKNAICILLVPILAHGAYDAIAMSELIDSYIGGFSSPLLIYFSVKMHKVVKNKMILLIKKDSQE